MMPIRRPVTTAMLFLTLVVFGWKSYQQLPINLMPDISYPTLTVRTEYEGAAPEDVEKLITRPLEETLSIVSGMVEISSVSSPGVSEIVLEFTWDTDMKTAQQDVRDRLDLFQAPLEITEKPVILRYDPTLDPVLRVAITPPAEAGGEDPASAAARQSAILTSIREAAERHVKSDLEAEEGIAQVGVKGGQEQEIQVLVDSERLKNLGLSILDVATSLAQQNINLSGGRLKEGKTEYLVRTLNEFRDVREIGKTFVANAGGMQVRLDDVADVAMGVKERDTVVRINGQEAVELEVFKEGDANTVQVCNRLKDLLGFERRLSASERLSALVSRLSNPEAADISAVKSAQLSRTIHSHLPRGCRLTLISDQSRFIEGSIDDVKQSAILGGALALVILYFFLREMRSTVAIGIAIPISVITVFIPMYLRDISLNIMSLGGLALGAGMLVDNSIVVLENIYRHMEMGKPRIQAALDGSREVAAAITSSTLTTVAVFVPVLFSQGVSAQTFKQLAVVVSFSLAASLLVALTIVPMMSSKFLTSSHHLDNRPGIWGRLYRFAGFIPEWMARTYGGALRWALSQKTIVILTALACIGTSVYLGGKLGFELQPELDEGELGVDVELEPGTRVAETDAIMQRLRKIVVANVPELKNILIESGSDGGGYRSGGQNRGEMRITLVPRSERTRSAPEVLASIRPLMQVEPGMRVQSRLRGSFINRLSRGFGDGDRLAVEVRGYDLDVLNDLGTKVLEAMSRVKGAMGPRIAVPPGNPEMVIRVDRAKASTLGLNVSDVAQTMETAIGGKQASMFRQDGDEFNILVRLQEKDRLDLAQLSQIPLTTPSGMVIPAGSVVKLQRREGPSQIQRKNQQRILTVSAALQDRDLGSTVRDLDKELRKIDLPDGYSFNFGSEYEEQEEAFHQMILAVILAITLVYMVMAAQFESLRDPFIILFSIPVASIGVVLSLLLTDTSVTIQALLGMIVLVGIVVNNGIVLVDYANQLRRDHGIKLYEAVIQAGEDRLRPIIMTTATTVLGLVPMAIGMGEGAELQTPLARVVIGGLTASTLITLLLIPVLYMIFEQFAEHAKERAAARQKNLEPQSAPASGD